MKTLGNETGTTVAGTFDCTILEYDRHEKYYIYSKDLVKTVSNLTLNNINFNQTIELVAIE